MMGSKRRVLIVEDHAGLSRILTLELQLNGFEVITAQNGLEALEQIINVPPDIIILDLFLPVLDGFGVLKRLQDNPRIPVIAISAYTDLAKKALESGADDFIAKPFDPEIIVDKIKVFLKQ